MKVPKNLRWQTIKHRDGKLFRGKGRDVKKQDILEMMRIAAKRGRKGKL